MQLKLQAPESLLLAVLLRVLCLVDCWPLLQVRGTAEQTLLKLGQ